MVFGAMFSNVHARGAANSAAMKWWFESIDRGSHYIDGCLVKCASLYHGIAHNLIHTRAIPTHKTRTCRRRCATNATPSEKCRSLQYLLVFSDSHKPSLHARTQHPVRLSRIKINLHTHSLYYVHRQRLAETT